MCHGWETMPHNQPPQSPFGKVAWADSAGGPDTFSFLWNATLSSSLCLWRVRPPLVSSFFSLRGRISQVSEERPIHRPNEKRTRRREPDEGTLAAQSYHQLFLSLCIQAYGRRWPFIFLQQPKRNSSLILQKRKRQDFFFFLGCSIDISLGRCIHIQLQNRLFFRPVLLHPTIRFIVQLTMTRWLLICAAFTRCKCPALNLIASSTA